MVIAEGPGHQRDTQLVLSQSGYEESLREEKIRFVDLNRNELVWRHACHEEHVWNCPWGALDGRRTSCTGKGSRSAFSICAQPLPVIS